MGGPDPQALLEAELRARRDSMPPSLARAVWQLVLGEVEASLETLRAVHEQAADSPATNDATIALIVGDRDAAKAHASVALGASSDWVAGWRQYQASVMALLVGDDAGLPLHRFALEQTADAHRAVEDGATGKVLITVADA